MKIDLYRDIDATPEKVWDALADISTHVEWMADARSITFVGDQRSGVGTTFLCLTVLGPLRTTDKMTVTRWVDGETMGVRHEGLVTGEGYFTISSSPTRIRWQEELNLPWWWGGPLAELVAKPILSAIWRGNLRRFAARVRP
jgi:carbon monoxide dehydrogenase subunit G